MLKSWNRPSIRIGSALVLATLAITAVEAGGPFRNPLRARTSVEQLAEKIDKLEKHIEVYGSVVAKTPDVWGEARLTKYRRNVETEFAKELVKFEPTVSATISRSDQAFLATATTFSAALGGMREVIITPAPTAANPAAQTVEAQSPPALPGDVAASFSKRLDLLEAKGTTLFAKDGAIGLEPTVRLDQLQRYLDHLNQLRRNNDGDDLSDSPGYAMHLVRIPVSVLPGSLTKEGYGAEINVIAKPHLHEKLLQETFRGLVINDIIDQLTLPLCKLIDNPEAETIINKVLGEDAAPAAVTPPAIENNIDGAPPAPLPVPSPVRSPSRSDGKSIYETRSTSGWTSLRAERLRPKTTSQVPSGISVDKEGAQKKLAEVVQRLPGVSISPSRRAQMPFNPDQLTDVYGDQLLAEVALTLLKLKADDHNKGAALLVDVQRVLSDNLHNAHGMLAKHSHLWIHCTPQLAQAVRQNDRSDIQTYRNGFADDLQKHHLVGTTVGALAWFVIVESALLNERLIDDMKLMQTAKNCFCLSTDWMDFYNPEPTPEAVAAFNQYVECRWPIHVFAIDPMTDDQNVVDAYSQRREMQLALSLAFATGNINATKFMRYARTLDLDMQSIALNRTAVGFSHGDDTFGWRFYPRVQSPPSRGNLTVATRELLIGGFTQDQQLKTRRLEPGMRECTAIVLLPAFVPYAIFDFRTNWFRLTTPHKREFDLEDGVEISKDIQSVRQLSQECVKDAHKYRPSEVYMLTRTVDQLERRLPLQTTYVQIPFENSLGGFEFFNGGSPDLAPELHGFYGEPGLSVTKAGSSIFLVGENFSVHETEVIVGNRRLSPDQVQLLSRQVMRITVDVDVAPLSDKVEIHVATPYGVSNHLEVPVVDPVAEAAAAAEAAVKKHVKDLHIDQFGWALLPTRNPKIVAKFNSSGKFSSVELKDPNENTPLRIGEMPDSEESLYPNFAITDSQLAAWLKFTSSDSAKEAVKVAAGPWVVPVNGEILLSDLVANGELLKALNDKKVRSGFDPTEIEFFGYVRGTASKGLPTFRLKNTFKLDVEVQPE